MSFVNQTTQNEDRDVCCICIDECEQEGLSHLPCGHIVHTVCLMNFCQYDIRCPVCREAPTGVNRRVLRAQETEQESEEDVVDTALIEAVNWMQSEWKRYKRRRNRYIRENPSLADMQLRLKGIRDTMDSESRITKRLYDLKCRNFWRSDSEIVNGKKILQNLRRREKRLERQLEEAVEHGIGEAVPRMSRRLLVYEASTN
jgi:hypothetical protein